LSQFIIVVLSKENTFFNDRMYVPRKKFYQRGGDDSATVTSLAANFNVTMSTVSSIIQIKGVNANSLYNQMAPQQIAKIVAVLDNQIATGNTRIGELTAQIGVIRNEIYRVPDGILEQYNNVSSQYHSTGAAYYAVSTQYIKNVSTYNGVVTELSTLSSTYISTSAALSSLQGKYSTIMLEYLSTKSTIDADVNLKQSTYDTYIDKYDSYYSTISLCSDNPNIYSDSLFDLTQLGSYTGSNGKFTVTPTGSDGTQAIWSKNSYSQFNLTMGYIPQQSYIIMLSPNKGDTPSTNTQGSIKINVSNQSTNNILIFNNNSIFITNTLSTFSLTEQFPLKVYFPSAVSSIEINTANNNPYNLMINNTIPEYDTISEYYIGFIFNQKMLLNSSMYSINTTTIAPFPFTVSESGNEKTYEVTYPAFPALPNVPYVETYAWSNYSFKTLSFTFMGAGVKVIFSTTNTGRPTKGFPGIFYGRATNRAKFTYNNSEAYIESGTGEPLTGQAMINPATITYDGRDLNLDGVVCPNIFNGAPIYIGFIFAGTFNIDTTLFPKNILKIMNWTGTPDPLTIPNITPAAINISSFSVLPSTCNTIINQNILLAGGEGSVNTLAWSPDGITWTGLGRTVFDTRVNAIAYNARMWVAVGYNQGSDEYTRISIAYSEDGINWKQVRDSQLFTFGEGFGVAWNGSLWIAVGGSGNGRGGQTNIAYSSDGKNWQDGNIRFQEGYSITWGNGMWIATGKPNGLQSGGIAYSYSGIDDWQLATATGGNVLFTKAGRGAAWNGSLWIAVGEGTNTMVSSTDGINWTPVANSPFGTDGIGRGITWGNNMWVATGARYNSAGAIEIGYATSTNGVFWDRLRKFVKSGTYSAAYNGKLWAIGGDGNQFSLITIKPENIVNFSVLEYNDNGKTLFSEKCLVVVNRNVKSLSNYDLSSLKINISNSHFNLSTSIEVSTLFSYETSTFNARMSTLLENEAATESSIRAYMSIYKNFQGSSMSIDEVIANYQSSLTSQLSTLDSGAGDFYTRQKTALLSEVNEYRYAAREYAAFLGVLTADIKLYKLNLYDEIDNLSFQIQIAASQNDLTKKSTLESQRLAMVSTQGIMQTEIEKIVPLDINYSNLDMIFDKEYKFKESFIDVRSTLYSYERNVLQYPDTKWGIQAEYNTKWTQMNNIITNINTQIGYRQNVMQTINDKLAGIKTDLTTPPLNQYKYDAFPPDFPYLYKIIEEQSQDPNSKSNFAVLKPIDFNS